MDAIASNPSRTLKFINPDAAVQKRARLSQLSAAILTMFKPKEKPLSKRFLRQVATGEIPRTSERVARRQLTDVQKIAANLMAEHVEHNTTAPGYRRRTVNAKKLRRQARRMIAAAK